MKQKIITYGIVACLTITLFANCSKTNTPETIASVQQKIKGNWQVVRETLIEVALPYTKSSSKDGSASDYYNFTADSVFVSSSTIPSIRVSYKVISPNQIDFYLPMSPSITTKIQTLTNSNCILYFKKGNDSVYTVLKVELKK